MQNTACNKNSAPYLLYCFQQRCKSHKKYPSAILVVVCTRANDDAGCAWCACCACCPDDKDTYKLPRDSGTMRQAKQVEITRTTHSLFWSAFNRLQKGTPWRILGMVRASHHPTKTAKPKDCNRLVNISYRSRRSRMTASHRLH